VECWLYEVGEGVGLVVDMSCRIQDRLVDLGHNAGHWGLGG
jgi:hypothetical protein